MVAAPLEALHQVRTGHDIARHRRFDFATRRVSEVRALPRDWDFIEFGGAFAVSPDGQWGRRHRRADRRERHHDDRRIPV